MIEERKENIKKDIFVLVEELLIKRNQIKEIPRIKAEIELEVGNQIRIKNVGIIEKREEIQKIQEPYNLLGKEIIQFKSILDEINTNYIKKSGESYKNLKMILDNENLHEQIDINNLLDELNNDLINALKNSKTQLNTIENILENSKLKKNLDLAKTEYSRLLSQCEGINIEKIKETDNEIEVKKANLERLKKIQLEVDVTINEISQKVNESLGNRLTQEPSRFAQPFGCIHPCLSQSLQIFALIQYTLKPYSHSPPSDLKPTP